MASHVTKIVDEIIKNKDQSIIIDGTREQLSIIIKFLINILLASQPSKTIVENLISYIFTELEELGLSLQKCRDQGYDIGVDRRGEKVVSRNVYLPLIHLLIFTFWASQLEFEREVQHRLVVKQILFLVCYNCSTLCLPALVRGGILEALEILIAKTTFRNQLGMLGRIRESGLIPTMQYM